jgi:hypothetical protein
MELRCRAARLAVGPRAVICDRTAAWIHGVDALAFWELDRPLPVETVVGPGEVRPRRAAIQSGERDLAAHDVEVIDGLLVTTAVRTALDLGCKLRRHHALASIDALMRIGVLSTDQLLAEIDRFKGRRGVVQLRELILLADPGAESPGESWLRLAIIDEGLPAPVCQFWVLVDGTPVYRLDLAYPKLRIAIEFDGQEFHSALADRLHDENRRAWLRAQGWHVIVVRADDLAPGKRSWLNELRRVVAERQRSPFRRGRYDVPMSPADPRRVAR